MIMDSINSLLGNLGGLNLGGRGASITRKWTQKPYKKNLGITDGDALPIVYNTMAGVLAIIGALAAGSVWTKIWEKTVPAQQGIAWGFGSPAFPHNQGYMWFCSIDEAGAAPFEIGVLRIRQSNALELKQETIAEFDDTRLHGTTSTTLVTATPVDINQMMPLPEAVDHDIVGEDSKLQLWYRCIAAATAEDNVGFSIPATIYQ